MESFREHDPTEEVGEGRLKLESEDETENAPSTCKILGLGGD